MKQKIIQSAFSDFDTSVLSDCETSVFSDGGSHISNSLGIVKNATIAKIAPKSITIRAVYAI